MCVVIKWNGNKLGKAKIRRLAFTSLFPFHLMITYSIFPHMSLYVIVLQVVKICILDLTKKCGRPHLKKSLCEKCPNCMNKPFPPHPLFAFIFILLSRESAGGAIFWGNPHPLRSCPFPSFPIAFLIPPPLTADVFYGQILTLSSVIIAFSICSRSNIMTSYDEAEAKCNETSSRLAYIPAHLDNVIETHIKKYNHGGLYILYFYLGNVQISYDVSGRGGCSNRQSSGIWGRSFGQIVISLL